jgi:hypothetical protein
MWPRLLLVVSFVLSLGTAAAEAASETCSAPLPFSAAQTEVRLIGAPGARCVFNTTREHADRHWVIEILEPPKNGTLKVTAGATKANPAAWIHEYRPNTGDPLTDRWVYRSCSRKATGDPTCETHVVNVELSVAAADERKLVCRAVTPVPVDFATSAAVTLAGPKGAGCYFWFPHAPTFWYDFPERPAHGAVTFRRPNLFLYQPSSKEVEADHYRVRLCSEKERVNCTTLDVTVHYGPVARMR